MTRQGEGGGWGVCLQEQRAQLLGRLREAGPTPADGEVPCRAAATVDGGLLLMQRSRRLVRRRHAPCGGEAQRSASLTKGERANVRSLDFTHFTQLSRFTSYFVTRLFCRSRQVKERFFCFSVYFIMLKNDWI